MFTDEQIFDIIDGCANQELLLNHASLLENSSEYKTYFEELESLHLELSTLSIEMPSAQFTENILSKLNFEFENAAVPLIKRKSWSNQLIYIFVGIIASVLAVLTIGLLSDFQLNPSTTKVPYFIIIHESLLSLMLFLENDFLKIAIIINLTVLLIIFDKKVLKPYFIDRKITLR